MSLVRKLIKNFIENFQYVRLNDVRRMVELLKDVTADTKKSDEAIFTELCQGVKSVPQLNNAAIRFVNTVLFEIKKSLIETKKLAMAQKQSAINHNNNLLLFKLPDEILKSFFGFFSKQTAANLALTSTKLYSITKHLNLDSLANVPLDSLYKDAVINVPPFYHFIVFRKGLLAGFVPDGNVPIKLFNLSRPEGSECVETIPYTGARFLAIHPTGTLVSGSANDGIMMWHHDQVVTQWLGKKMVNHQTLPKPFLSLTTLPSGEIITGHIGQLAIWTTFEAVNKKPTYLIEVPCYINKIVVLSTNGQFATLGPKSANQFEPKKNNLMIWAYSQSEGPKCIVKRERSAIKDLLPLQNNLLATIAHDTYDIRIFELTHSGLQYNMTLSGHTAPILSMAPLPSGQFATGSEDGVVKIWDANESDCVATLLGHAGVNGAVTNLAVVDGRLVSIDKSGRAVVHITFKCAEENSAKVTNQFSNRLG